MEEIYAALLLDSAGKKVDEAGLKKILEAAGQKPNEAKLKALVASLEGINIKEAIKSAAFAPAPVAGHAAETKAEKKEEKEEEKAEAKAEEAAAGLSSLFG